MTHTILVTGSASGIGRATAARLKQQGVKVVGVDLRDADIEVDLALDAGRRRMVEEAVRLAPAGLDGVLAAAGIASPERAADTVSVNYFGAVHTLEGLRPLLASRPASRAVAICSTAAMLGCDAAVVDACLAGDEPLARRAIGCNPQQAYSTSKRALSLWLRRAAVSPAWAGSQVLLNGVAPGVVETAMTAPLFGNPAALDQIRMSNPIAVTGYATPEEIAELTAYLLTFQGHYLLGQIIYVDGGTDAITRPDVF